jgi:hypothetical protein
MIRRLLAVCQHQRPISLIRTPTSRYSPGKPQDADARLRSRLYRGSYFEAVISELTALEIHSVLGKLARGRSGGSHDCERYIASGGRLIQCSQRWVQHSLKPLRPLEFNRLRKAVHDVESGHGPIRVSVVLLESVDFAGGRGHLYSHAYKWRFGSHDAVIVAASERHAGGATRFVTSDTSLKSLLKAINRRFYDPQKDELWGPSAHA